ncbi:hypothetical protein BAE44_0002102 [Dichanthelium oligosanthes]|uniref:Uncharacterized protein n=1 Tax=Dichanthelium oligosanthes TaxID=888268 RepID=A0A1E5WHN7_9POAL|nr:hypothetical protein BAE44_0002102 [Dichanthelium oligosanthes]
MCSTPPVSMPSSAPRHPAPSAASPWPRFRAPRSPSCSSLLLRSSSRRRRVAGSGWPGRASSWRWAPSATAARPRSRLPVAATGTTAPTPSAPSITRSTRDSFANLFTSESFCLLKK